MKSIPAPIFAIFLCLLCACGEPENKSDFAPSLPYTASPQIPSASLPSISEVTPAVASPAPVPDTTVLSDEEETDPEGRILYKAHGDTICFFSLFAMIPAEGIYLYGLNPTGMILYQDNIGTYFNWHGMTPRNILPQMIYYDLDGDGKNELAVTLYHGSGTGVSLMDLHILRKEADISAFTNTYTEFSLLAHEVSNWMTEPIIAIPAAEKNSFVVEICGSSHVINNDVTQDYTFTGIYYGNYVHFEFVETGIRTKVMIEAFYDEVTIPLGFGYIEADVIFDGEKLTLENHIFNLLD